MTERVVVGELPVGGAEPLISSAVRWGDLLFLRAGADRHDDDAGRLRRLRRAGAKRPRSDHGVARRGRLGPEHVLRVQCYLLRAGDFGEWNRIWAEAFLAPRPVRTTIVTEFTVPGMLIEIEVTAGIPS